MKMNSRFLKAAGGALVAMGLLTEVNSQGATVDVEVRDSFFSPSTVTINVGDTVRWTQRGFMTHTTTSDDGLWNSGNLVSMGQTFSYTFEEAGSYGYFCIPHSGFMSGTVVVEAAEPNPPTVSITAPTSGTILSMPGDVTITATASVEGSTITSVEFFNGETSLGSDTEEPYEITVSLAAGTHSLTARATSAAGASTTSAAVMVEVESGSTAVENPFPELIAKSDTTIELEAVLTGLVAPLGMAAPDDGTGRLFIYEQTGVVHVLEDGVKVAEPLMDVSSRLVDLREGYDERGLLGLAVHPDFANNPLVYTYTSEPIGPVADFPITPAAGEENNHQSVIAEWRMDAANPNRVDPASRREIMRLDQPQSNHNGGVMHFGPDGFLYVSLGDGGRADDEGSGHSPGGNGQDINNLLGAVIRIDVDARTSANGQYGVPGDNPFVGEDGLDEIYAYGFRNPFSWSFDQLTGELYVADVGQNQIEELDRVFLGGNYGWPVKEGSFYFDQNGEGDGFVTETPVLPVPPNLADPIAEYDHDDGICIVGGYVYRGRALPNLIGTYITGELGTFQEPLGRLLFLDRSEFKEFQIGLDDRELGRWVKGFGQDQEGEVYVFTSGNIGPDGTTGEVLKIVPADHNISITQVMVMDANLMVHWENGVGPFVVQAKNSLADQVWQTVAASGTRDAMVPMTGSAGFLRIVDTAGTAPVGFTVHMTGAGEQPDPVETAGTGQGTLSLEGNTLQFDIYYQGLSGAATMGHIHGPASASESTGVMIGLDDYAVGGWSTSGSISGSIDLTPEQKAHILNGKTYVNIHTAANGGGEIRGQITPVLFTAELTGAAERPEPVETEGRGLGLFLLSGNQLTFNISYGGLSSVANNAHIHGPADVDTSIGVLVGLADFNGGEFGTAGTLNGTVELTPEQLGHLVDGQTYVNIHTANHSPGEIRGQIIPKTTAIALSASLSGAAERPVVETPATGEGIFAIEGDTLHFSISYTGLKQAATMAHIHGPATAEESIGVLIDLGGFRGGEFDTSGTFSGSVELTPLQRTYILEGLTYVNVHSGAHGSGEIRGQIAPVVMNSVMLGTSEHPAIHPAGRGQGTLLLVGDQLTVGATYRDLTSPSSNAHIHGPADISGSAGVLVGLGAPHNGDGFGATSGALSGTVTLVPENLARIIDERTYINVHTTENGSGEIRGQIVR